MLTLVSIEHKIKMSQKALDTLKSQRDSLEADLISSGGKAVLLTEARKAVLAQRPLELLQNLKEGKVTAVEALEAFQAKAIEESKRTNCITGFVEDAKVRAMQLDEMRSNGSIQGPLHGLPMSVKDIIHVKGTDSTLGLAKYVGKPVIQDAPIVAAFRRLGAVPFAKTNIPQLCLSASCRNPVFGETTNPHDINRSPGGSTGGEGALIAGGGSFLGLGTDIGGSVRIPAHFCGIASIRPTRRRTPEDGWVDPTPGIVGIRSVFGIMAKDTEMVIAATKAYLSLNLTEYDPDLPPLAWREDVFLGSVSRPLENKLKIGWYDDIGFFASTPGVKRAVKESAVILKGLGHELIPFMPPDVARSVEIAFGLLTADSGANGATLLEGEIKGEATEYFGKLYSIPAKLREIARPYVAQNFGDLNCHCTASVDSGADLWNMMVERERYVKKFYESWKAKDLDLLLCPVWPMPALPRNFNEMILPCVVYTMLYNLLDLPCGVLPFTKENAEDQKLLPDYRSDDKLHQLVKEYTKGATGMPIGVQFVALPFQEENLCRMMLEFTKATQTM